jgi:glycerol kinase
MTNAARTLLYDIQKRDWSVDLAKIFDVPLEILPQVRPSSHDYGVIDEKILGYRLSLRAVCGDQQSSFYAALSRFNERESKTATKVTMGTGTFVAQALGLKFGRQAGFFTTLAPGSDKSIYILESKIEGSAATVDGLLNNQPALIRYLKKLAIKIRAQIKRLPVKPSKVVIDGGIIRDGLMRGILEQVLGIPVEEQKPYDGTGLGTAELVFKRK